MEHKPFTDLQTVADLTPDAPVRALTRYERLERWAAALERDPTRRLRSLHQIEWMEPRKRREIREDNSALSVAFEDPVLRADGLAGDRLGDAIDFFELSSAEAHAALCSCHYGDTVQAGIAARGVREIMRREHRSSMRRWWMFRSFEL